MFEPVHACKCMLMPPGQFGLHYEAASVFHGHKEEKCFHLSAVMPHKQTAQGGMCSLGLFKAKTFNPNKNSEDILKYASTFCDFL